MVNTQFVYLHGKQPPPPPPPPSSGQRSCDRQQQPKPRFQVHTSPLMKRSKDNSDKKRIVLDLSWPKGCSVNDGVTPDVYLDTYFKLTYSSIDDITNTLKKLGPWAMLFKVNISSAFRHIRIAPLTYWEYIIMTPMLPFDFRHGSTFFHNCCDTICHIMCQHGFPYFWNYIDELIYTDLPSQIYNAYQFLINLLSELGLDVSKEKLVAPATAVTFLGILIDTRTRTISIPHSKLQEIRKLCKDWTHKTSCTESQLQSLFRSLLYISKCVQPARCFLNRMLALLRANHESNIIQLTEDFAKDCSWYFWTLKIVFHIMILRVFDEAIYLDALYPYTWIIKQACVVALTKWYVPFPFHLVTIFLTLTILKWLML